MAATTEKAALIQQLRRTNAALTESNAELEKQYLAALEARRMKDEFLANISHELRTPLTAVLGYADLMQEGLSGPLTGEQSSTIDQMTSASQRLLELIDDLLELTTLKGGEARLTVESFDAREAMKDALAAAREPAAGVVVKLKMSESDAILDPQRPAQGGQDPHQSAEQRLQVHHRGRRAGRPRKSQQFGALLRTGYGHRDRPGRA